MLLGIAALALSMANLFVVQHYYRTNIEAQLLLIEKYKFDHVQKQNEIFSQNQHDLRNQLTIISMMVEKKDLQRLSKYLEHYKEAIDQTITGIKTGVKELDLLFFSKLSEAKAKGVKIELLCSTVIKAAQKYSVDLVSLFANILDNAIQACSSYNGAAARTLCVSLEQNDQYYTFTVSNTAHTSNIRNALNQKQNDLDPNNLKGVGISIIKKVVKRLLGSVKWSIEGDWVRVTVKIPVQALLK
jgi:two-component system sensor histidine kinase AgrC